MDKNLPPIPIISQELDDEAILQPKHLIDIRRTKAENPDLIELPSKCIMIFRYMKYIIKHIKETKTHKELTWYREPHYPMKLTENDVEICVAILPGIGAPYHAAFLEELVELGVNICVLFGGVGVLPPEISRGDVIIPVRAIREEGTSYHYLPPSTYAESDTILTDKLINAFKQQEITVHVGDTWTTDGIYRETKKKIARYRQAGILSIEMEAAAHFAVGKFRGIKTAAVFYSGDCIGGDEWDYRDDEESMKKCNESQKQILDVILETLSEDETE